MPTLTYAQMYKPHCFSLCTNGLAEDIYDLGVNLTKPWFHQISVAVRLFRYQHPGKSFRAASWAEIGKQALNVIALVTLVIPILSLLLAVVGYPLRFIGAAFRPNAGVLQVRNNQPDRCDGGRDGLNMLCLNTAGMVPFISHYNHMCPPLERAPQIGDYIASSGADIVFLQEVFHPEFTKSMWFRCKEQYKYALHSITPQEIGLGTGLMIMSKYKIESVSYMNFSDSAGDDAWSKKGAVAATLDLGQGKKLTVVNVHMQSESLFNEMDHGAVTRAKQMAELANFVGAIRTDVVLAGDFNFKNDAELDSEVHRLLNQGYLRANTGDARTWYVKDHHWGTRNWQQAVCPISNYDHFFYRGSLGGRGEARHFYRAGDPLPPSPMSDHRPLHATFQLN